MKLVNWRVGELVNGLAVRLRSRLARTGAHAFYARLGYSVAKQQLQFRKEL